MKKESVAIGRDGTGRDGICFIFLSDFFSEVWPVYEGRRIWWDWFDMRKWMEL